MADGRYYLLIAIVILIILSSLFSATETAYTSLSTTKLKSLVLKDKRYKKVLDLQNKYDKLLSTILVGNNIVNILASSLSMVFFALIIKDRDVTAISTAVITIVVLLFGEITPKNISKAYPEKIALFTYPFIMFCFYLFYPVNLIFSGYKFLLNKLFKLDREVVITDEELITIVNEAEEDGTIKEEESVLIKSAIEFDDLEVKDVLIPRINMIAVPDDITVDELKKVFESEGYSRVPVYTGTIDSVIGFIHEKDFYRQADKPDFKLKSVIQEVLFVAEYTKISVLLKRLQSKKIHMAVVLDEYGGTLGIVTLEDIIEELVGEIYDEYDEVDSEIRKTESGDYIVPGSHSLTDMFEEFEVPGDEEFDSNTVGGWISECVGELPKLNTKFEYKNLSVQVTKCTKKQVLEIKVKIIEYVERDENDN